MYTYRFSVTLTDGPLSRLKSNMESARLSAVGRCQTALNLLPGGASFDFQPVNRSILGDFVVRSGAPLVLEELDRIEIEVSRAFCEHVAGTRASLVQIKSPEVS